MSQACMNEGVGKDLNFQIDVTCLTCCSRGFNYQTCIPFLLTNVFSDFLDTPNCHAV